MNWRSAISHDAAVLAFDHELSTAFEAMEQTALGIVYACVGTVAGDRASVYIDLLTPVAEDADWQVEP